LRTLIDRLSRRVFFCSVLCGSVAVLAGVLFLFLNGAPTHYWGINLAAWLIGLVVAVPLRPQSHGRFSRGCVD
jgi:hypothetical protein